MFEANAPQSIRLNACTHRSLLLKVYSDFKLLGTATGFVVNASGGRPFLITNRHVVTGRHQDTDECLDPMQGTPTYLEVHHHKHESLGTSEVKRMDLLGSNDEQKWKEHPVGGGSYDFVALEIEDTQNVWLFDYDLEDSEKIVASFGVTEIVSVVGFPFGKTLAENLAIWATGFIASEPPVDYEEFPVFLVDCRSRAGQSGSPVIAYRYPGQIMRVNGEPVINKIEVTKFLGIYSGRINKDSDIGRVWKTSAIVELIKSL